MPDMQQLDASPNLTLTALRINKGMSPNDLARAARTTGNTIRLAERGFAPGPRIQFAVAHVLGREPLDIWPLERQKVHG